MKIYLAARYSRNEEMRLVRDDLRRLGHVVTSRWIDQHGRHELDDLIAISLNDDPLPCSQYAVEDIIDLERAHCVISFTSEDGGGRGGRHVELGMAIALRKELFIVGPRENIFHTLPYIQCFADLPEARKFFCLDVR